MKSKATQLWTRKLPIKDEALRFLRGLEVYKLHLWLDAELLAPLHEIGTIKDDEFFSAWPYQDRIIRDVRGACR